MTIDLLHGDLRFSSNTRSVLWMFLPHDFQYDEEGKVIGSRAQMDGRKSKLGAAKKEVEKLGGYLTFSPRGKKVIEIFYKIPK